MTRVKYRFTSILFFCILCLSPASASTSPVSHLRTSPNPPKLIVLLVIDQFRSDYLTRFESEFQPGGFKLLLSKGAYFPMGEYDVLQSMTGPGHATVLTGSYPYQSGIPINDWYDRSSQQKVYCVEDNTHSQVGIPQTPPHAGTSPKNLIGTTVGDELKLAGMPSRVVSLALKDRAAILMGGKSADMALWFDAKSFRWITSTYYTKAQSKELPSWIEKLNQSLSKTAEKYKHTKVSSPLGLEITVDAAEKALEEYQLGRGRGTDVLAISFSAHDYVGHAHGPNSPEVKEMVLAEDRQMARLLSLIQKKMQNSLNQTLFVLTSDHGVSPTPEWLRAHRVESQSIKVKTLMEELESELVQKLGKPGQGNWISHETDGNFFLNQPEIQKKGLALSEVEEKLKALLLKRSWVASVFTSTEYQLNRLPPMMHERQIKKTYFSQRSGDVIVIPKPFALPTSPNETTHMTGYAYDRVVPILFMGAGVRAQRYAERAEVVDIAPTLSFILGLTPPALSEGRVLREIFK